MIKAIIFDCYGVLVTSSIEPFYKKYFANNSKLIKEANYHLDRGSKGSITHDEVMKRYAELAGITPAQVTEALSEHQVNEDLFTYIREDLRPKYKIGFLSNASADSLKKLFTPEQRQLFEVMVLSYDIGFAKPEPEAYEITAERLGVRLDECVFVDDRQPYVEGAHAVGMKAVVFKSAEQFKKDLPALLKD